MVLADGSVVLIQERGKTVRASRRPNLLWRARIPFAVLNGGPVADATTASVQGVTGQTNFPLTS